MKQIDKGYFHIKSREQDLFIGIIGNKVLSIDLKHKSLEIKTNKNNTYIKKLHNSNYKNVSYYEFYEAYKSILKLTDDFLGVRNLLIDPNDISNRIDVDNFGRLYIIE